MVYLPLWKILVTWDDDIPNTWKIIKNHVPNQQSEYIQLFIHSMVKHHSYWKWPFIVSFPIKKMWFSIVFLYVFQRVPSYYSTQLPNHQSEYMCIYIYRNVMQKIITAPPQRQWLCFVWPHPSGRSSFRGTSPHHWNPQFRLHRQILIAIPSANLTLNEEDS